MVKIILLRYFIKRKHLTDLQLKELAKYFFTLSSLGIGSILVKLFEAEKLTLDRNSLFGVTLLLLAALFFVYVAVKLLGEVQENN